MNPQTSFADDFDSFDDTIWNEQCSGCSYSSGELVINGDEQQQQALVASLFLSTIEGQFTFDDSDDDAFVMISPYSDASFEWALDTNIVKFVWDSNFKKIYGQSALAYTDCSSLSSSTITFTLTIGSSKVHFEDTNCGTLTLSNEGIGGDFDSLFVYVGADCDGCDTDWHYLYAYVDYDKAGDDDDGGYTALSTGAVVGIVLASVLGMCCILTITLNAGCFKSEAARNRQPQQQPFPGVRLVCCCVDVWLVCCVC